MNLGDLDYQVLDRWKIEVINHKDLLWKNRQVVRLREKLFHQVENILEAWEIISLYNLYSPINIDLLRDYKQKPKNNSWAMIAKIIDENNMWPILEGWSLAEIKIHKMFNVDFENIEQKDLQKSIAFKNWEEINIANLIKWLNNTLYDNRYKIEDIENQQKLFFRQITL